MLDVRRMQVLRAVITSGSITAAAKNLGYTPSAISQQLSTLEREAGTVLLERAGRGVRPTAAGTVLAEHAGVVSKQLAKAEAALADVRDGRTGRLSIRYFATAGAALLPAAVTSVTREFPGIQLDLKLAEPAKSMPQVEAGTVDVAITVVAGARVDYPGVEMVHLLDDFYRILLPRGHPLARKRVIDMSDLAEEPWVGNEGQPGPCRDIVLNACGAAGFAPNFAVESDDYQTAQGFVAAGVGVSLVPGLALGSTHPAVVTRKVRRPTPVRAIYGAIAARSREQPAVRHLLAAIRGDFAERVAAG